MLISLPGPCFCVFDVHRLLEITNIFLIPLNLRPKPKSLLALIPASLVPPLWLNTC